MNELDTKIMKLYNQGHTYEYIEKKFAISRNVVRKCLANNKEEKLPLRKRFAIRNERLLKEYNNGATIEELMAFEFVSEGTVREAIGLGNKNRGKKYKEKVSSDNTWEINNIEGAYNLIFAIVKQIIIDYQNHYISYEKFVEEIKGCYWLGYLDIEPESIIKKVTLNDKKRTS